MDEMATTDAMVWAKEFCRIFSGRPVWSEALGTPASDLVVDEGTMVGWFANAIEVGRSAGYHAWQRENEAPTVYSEPICICPRFSDTGGYRIADLTCPVHGTNGTDPGDGYWQDEGDE